MKTTSFCGITLNAVQGIFLFCCIPNLLPAQFSVNITATHVSCFGASDGQAEAISTGGTPPFTFAWNNGATSQLVQNLIPGIYSVTVTDANQDTALSSTTITQPNPVGLTLGGQSQLCDVAPDGMALVIPDGGTTPYTYLWSNGANTAQINNLVAGTYTATVTDTRGCTKSGSYTLNYWADGIWMHYTPNDTECGLETGSATAFVITGTPPYQFQWSNGDTTQNISNLAAGTYTLLVSDANGCANHFPYPVHIGTNYPIPVTTFLSDPFCITLNATFTEDVPVEYPQIWWTLNDPLDNITEGQGTDSIQIQWASAGSKTVTMQYGVDNVFCGSVAYTLEVTVCTDSREPLKSSISITPNPFADYLQIETEDEVLSEFEVLLLNISGLPVIHENLFNNANRLSTAHLPPGIYLLKVKSKKYQRVVRMVKL